jgi:hypothetical protein
LAVLVALHLLGLALLGLFLQLVAQVVQLQILFQQPVEHQEVQVVLEVVGKQIQKELVVAHV